MMKKKYYFTFGCGIDNPHFNCYHVEVAEDYGKARERMVEKFGTGWAFQYTEEEWRISREEYQVNLDDAPSLGTMASRRRICST